MDFPETTTSKQRLCAAFPMMMMMILEIEREQDDGENPSGAMEISVDMHEEALRQLDPLTQSDIAIGQSETQKINSIKY
jgi:hypothetical protein